MSTFPFYSVRCCNPPVFDSQYELMKSVDVLKAGLIRHREDDEEPVSCPHVLLPHCTEFLLTGCVQHCEDGDTQMYSLMWVSLSYLFFLFIYLFF